MADIYTPPPSYSYNLGEVFSMPHIGGDKRAVSYGSKGAAMMTAGISIVITFSFLFVWNLIAFFALFFSRSQSRRRYVALVTLWNSNDTWFAFNALAGYSIDCFKDRTSS
ncbi:hypothetical protein ACJ41O_005673 [Fusarium nematophilum]